MNKFISLCVLAYKRPHWLLECLESLRNTADLPYQLIVNIDGADGETAENMYREWKNGRISNLILSGGNNRGVGRAFQNCIGLCEGEYIVKVDADLTFKPYWLSTVIKILHENPELGAVSLFDYRHYDALDTRFEIIENKGSHLLVNDFVSSIYAFRAKDIPKIAPVEDDGNHTKLGQLAITPKDYVINRGFGVGKSVYVSGTPEQPFKTPTHNSPLVFNSGLTYP